MPLDMDSESKNQNDLLKQLKILQAEKELLEKHVYVLNECLSVEELKIKVADLEKKKEMLISFENAIERLRTEIEPLKFLKSILENKLLAENQTNKIGSGSSINLESAGPQIGFNVIKTPTEHKYFKPQSTQSVPNDITESDSISLEKLSYDEVFVSTQKLTKSNSESTINDGSVDECMQLLDQYDVLTDQEMLNILNEQQLSIISTIEQKPTTSNADNIDIKTQDKPTPETNTTLDTDCITVPLNYEKILGMGVKESVLINNLDTMNADYKNSELLKASSSQPLFQTQDSLCSDSNFSIGDCKKSQLPKASSSQPLIQTQDNACLNSSVSIGDLLLKIPQLLLEQGVEALKEQAFKVEHNSSEILKNHAKRDETVNKNNLKTLQKEVSDNAKSINSSHNSELFNTNKLETPINSFNDMNLKIDILRGIYSLGFVNPTVLQRRVVVPCVNGQDVIVFAGPSNGRTLMFTIPLLQRINANVNECQALVLVPTRNLAIHVKKIIMSVGDFLGINVCIGGDNVPRKLSVVPHVVVGTPSGVTSMIACKSLFTDSIQTVVLNKVENMLSPNFAKLIEELMRKLVKNKQVTLVASDKLDRILDVYMDTLQNPLIIIDENNKDKKMEIVKNLPKQFYLNIQEEWKMNALCEINETLGIKKAVVFCNTFDKAQKLCDTLQRLEYAVSLFHLETNALEREHKLEMFATDNLRMLITTDPCKGSQFQQAAWIINYDLPINSFCYLNRVAMCAKNVKVINFINENDDHTKMSIETHNNFYMIQMPLNMVDLLQY